MISNLCQSLTANNPKRDKLQVAINAANQDRNIRYVWDISPESQRHKYSNF